MQEKCISAIEEQLDIFHKNWLYLDSSLVYAEYFLLRDPSFIDIYHCILNSCMLLNLL